MKRTLKGQFGYIKNQRKIELAKTLIMLALCVATYYIGIFSTGSNKNLLTFVAILGVLPMAKFAVSTVLFSKAKGCSEELHEKLISNNVTVSFYDLYMTAYKSSFAFSAVVYGKDSLVFLSEDEKLNENEAKAHVEQVLRNISVENVTVKIFIDSDKFIERAKQLNDGGIEEMPTVIADNILSVSI